MKKILFSLLMVFAVPVYAQLNADTAYNRLEEHLAYCNTKSDKDVLKNAHCSRTWAVLDQNERLEVYEARYYPELFDWTAVDAHGNEIGPVTDRDSSGLWRIIEYSPDKYLRFYRNRDHQGTLQLTVPGYYSTNTLGVDSCDGPYRGYNFGADDYAVIVSGGIYSTEKNSDSGHPTHYVSGGSGENIGTCTTATSWVASKTYNIVLRFEAYTSDYPGPWTFIYERK